MTAKTEILYGYHPVAEAIAAGRRRIETLFLAEGKRSERAARLAEATRSRGVLLRTVPEEELSRMTGVSDHQGIALSVSPFPLTPFEDFCSQRATAVSDALVLFLDQVTDPHNLGAVIRTALCTGVAGILCPRDRSAPPNPTAAKASAGALEHVCLSQVTNAVTAISRLKAAGFWVCGLDPEAPEVLYQADLTGPLVLVIGSEQKGIRPLVRRHCDFRISIPQAEGFNSLNASVASAVVLYEIYRQRHYRQSIGTQRKRTETQ